MNCPACERTHPFLKLEDHWDPLGQKSYTLYSCLICQIVFTEPRVPVGADWYEKAAPPTTPQA